MPRLHLHRLVLFVLQIMQYLVILSHIVSDFDLVISVAFFN